MKVYLILLLATIALSTSNLREVQAQSVGRACGETDPIFVISSFTLSIWPPTPGGIALYNMTGKFKEAERISQIHEAFFTPQQTNYIDIDVDVSYTVGQEVSFTYGVQYASLPGNYKIQWWLQNGGPTFISCWQVNYSLT